MIKAEQGILNPIRVLIVDDSLFVRKALMRVFSSDPAIEVAGVAMNGKEAFKKALELAPDVITLDVMMPVMDGLEALRAIMEMRPVPVLMLSQFTREGGELTLKALELGAMDFVDKSSASLMDFQLLAEEILVKIKTISRHKPKRLVPDGAPAKPYTPSGNIDAVAIGASTGGPPALQMILQKMPADIGFAIVVAQHMPKGFTGTLATRLDLVCDIRVKEAQDGDRMEPGTAYIAPSGIHTKLAKGKGGRIIKLDPDPEELVHKPSVDVLFRSVAETYANRSIAVVLTGMGSDGAKGLPLVKKKGGITIAQDEGTSVIFGMPRAAAETGRLDEILPVTEIADRILELG